MAMALAAIMAMAMATRGGGRLVLVLAVPSWRLQQEVVAYGLWVVAHGHGGGVGVAPRGGREASGGPPGGRGLSLPRAGVG